MRKQNSIITLALLGSLILSGGCTKTSYVHKSGPIEFATTSKGTQTTKTVYGDDVEDEGTKYQALNWVTGDLITIASPQAPVQNDASGKLHAADYKVTWESNGVPSKGTISNAEENGLMWADNYTGKYDFYAVYPNVGEDLSLDYTKGEFTARILPEQEISGSATVIEDTFKTSEIKYNSYKPNMAYAYMSAAANGVTPPEGDNKVELKFVPAFTAFEFFVSSQDDEIELTEFEILSPGKTDKLSGQFTKQAGENGEAAKAATDATYSVKATIPAEGKVDSKTGLNFTIFTIPVTNTGALRLRFTSKDGKDKDGKDVFKTSYLDLKYSDNAENAGAAVQFLGGHKYRIHMLKLPSSQWQITISAKFESWVLDEEKEVTIYI